MVEPAETKEYKVGSVRGRVFTLFHLIARDWSGFLHSVYPCLTHSHKLQESNSRLKISSRIRSNLACLITRVCTLTRATTTWRARVRGAGLVLVDILVTCLTKSVHGNSLTTRDRRIAALTSIAVRSSRAHRIWKTNALFVQKMSA